MSTNNLDLNNIPERMSVVVEKFECLEDASHRRRKDFVIFLIFIAACVLGLAVSLYVIVFDRQPEATKLAWPAFTAILGLIAGRFSKS